jgi:hypothetical protein
MTIVSFIVLLVIAAIAGSIGQFLAGYSRGGLSGVNRGRFRWGLFGLVAGSPVGLT